MKITFFAPIALWTKKLKKVPPNEPKLEPKIVKKRPRNDLKTNIDVLSKNYLKMSLKNLPKCA